MVTPPGCDDLPPTPCFTESPPHDSAPLVLGVSSVVDITGWGCLKWREILGATGSDPLDPQKPEVEGGSSVASSRWWWWWCGETWSKAVLNAISECSSTPPPEKWAPVASAASSGVADFCCCGSGCVCALRWRNACWRVVEEFAVSCCCCNCCCFAAKSSFNRRR